MWNVILKIWFVGNRNGHHPAALAEAPRAVIEHCILPAFGVGGSLLFQQIDSLRSGVTYRVNHSLSRLITSSSSSVAPQDPIVPSSLSSSRSAPRSSNAR